MRRGVVMSALAALMLLAAFLAPARAQPVALTVELTEYRISPNQFEVTLGEQVQIQILNNGTIDHTFVIETYANYDTNITPGGRPTVSFTADTVGTYPMYCVLPGHRGQGMEGTFTISRVVVTPPLPVVEIVGLLVVTAVIAVGVVMFLRSRRDSET